jgi:hypothetical protein
MEEIWKDIPNYEGYYQASSMGRIKRLDRYVPHYRGGLKLVKEKIRKQTINHKGYYRVCLCKNGKQKTKLVSILVAEAFLKHIPCGHKLVVDHINFNTLDNRVDNLRIITHRENVCHRKLKGSSEYAGVTWSKAHNKWRSKIRIKGKQLHLGLFLIEIEASNAYQNALKTL